MVQTKLLKAVKQNVVTLRAYRLLKNALLFFRNFTIIAFYTLYKEICNTIFVY